MKRDSVIIWSLYSLVVILLMLLYGGYRFLGKYIPLEIALQDIKKHTYNDDYVCADFSRDLVNELKTKGIQAEIEIGESPVTLKEDWQHAWVGVWIEPQSGEFTNNYTK